MNELQVTIKHLSGAAHYIVDHEYNGQGSSQQFNSLQEGLLFVQDLFRVEVQPGQVFAPHPNQDVQAAEEASGVTAPAPEANA